MSFVLRGLMFDESIEMWVIHMAYRHGIDLEEQLFLGLLDRQYVEDAFQRCLSCSQSCACRTRLGSPEPLIEIPDYCVNADFLKQVEQLNCAFWRGIELEVASSSVLSLIEEPTGRSIQGNDTQVCLDNDTLNVGNWQALQKQSVRWEWRYTCENWLLCNVNSDDPMQNEQWDQNGMRRQTSISDRALSKAEFGFWLMRSAARKLGVDLHEAMNIGDFTAQKYAAMVVNCCKCSMVDECQAWLDQPQADTECALSGCANAIAFAEMANLES